LIVPSIREGSALDTTLPQAIIENPRVKGAAMAAAALSCSHSRRRYASFAKGVVHEIAGFLGFAPANFIALDTG
jgi:hypothetical protein